MKHLSNFYLLITFIVIAFDFITIVYMLFKEQRKPNSIMIWLLTFILLPVAGFVLYLLIGKGPSLKKQRVFYKKMQKDKKFIGYLKDNLTEFKKLNFSQQGNLNDTVEFNVKYNKAPVSLNNDVTIYTDISKNFDDMLCDIEKATKSVDILYFIYKKDDTGTILRDVLVKKAKQGIKIRLIVDDIGSLWADGKFFKPLTDCGGEFYRFLQGKWKYLNRNLNYRNHRKMVIIDDKIAYTGGANIGDEYLNKTKLNWRDTNIKIIGDGVALIKIRFLQDYSYVCGKDIKDFDSTFFESTVKNVLPMQLISSGPDVESEEIKETYIKMIYGAKKRVWIQTPYYIPDESFATAISIAVESGIDVRIMIPEFPDKKLVYYATKSYASDMVKLGAKVYFYPGFLHSKTLIIDDGISSIGTFNIDIRSFKLHFEMTTLLYGRTITNKMSDIFVEDMKKSSVMDDGYIKLMSKRDKFMQALMRLFSPLF